MTFDPDIPLHRQRRSPVRGLERAVACFCLDVDAPAQPSQTEIARESIEAQWDNRDKLNQLNRDRLFTQTSALGDLLLGTGTITEPGERVGLVDLLGRIQPGLQQQAASANTAQRAADIADVQNLGGAAVSAIQNANPQQKALVDALNADALSGLQAGSSLNPSQQRQINQATRTAQAARGFGMGLNDISAEALASQGFGEALADRRRQQAGVVAGLNQAVTGDPFMALTGRSSGVGGQAQGLLGSANQQATASAYDPFNAFTQDYWNTGYNAQAAANIASSNNRAGVIGGALGAL